MTTRCGVIHGQPMNQAALDGPAGATRSAVAACRQHQGAAPHRAASAESAHDLAGRFGPPAWGGPRPGVPTVGRPPDRAAPVRGRDRHGIRRVDRHDGAPQPARRKVALHRHGRRPRRRGRRGAGPAAPPGLARAPAPDLAAPAGPNVRRAGPVAGHQPVHAPPHPAVFHRPRMLRSWPLDAGAGSRAAALCLPAVWRWTT